MGVSIAFCNFLKALNNDRGAVIAGRALEWHSRGQRFDPAYLHQVKRLETKVSSLFVLPLWCAALNRFAQINHVPELNVVFVYGVVVVGYEKVPHNVGTGEAAFFIEGDSERAVAGTDL